MSTQCIATHVFVLPAELNIGVEVTFVSILAGHPEVSIPKVAYGLDAVIAPGVEFVPAPAI